MEVEFLSAFLKDLNNFGEVEVTKNLSDIKNLKKLKGHKSAYRIRIGDYRIGIFLELKKVEFARVLHRKDIYRLFP